MHARAELADKVEVRTSLLDRISLALAVIALMLVGVQLVLTSALNAERRALAEEQSKIAQAQLLLQVNNRLIQMLATASAETGDAEIRQLLASNGVSFSIRPRPAAPAPAQPGVQP